MEFKRPLTEIEWAATPPAVRQYIEMLEKSILNLTETIADLKGRTQKLEHRVKGNSQNSSQLPSADGLFTKPERNKKKTRKKKGGQKGHQGHRQQMLKPTKTVAVQPAPCSCGCKAINKTKPFYTHQHIELLEIKLGVTHCVLHKGTCGDCGKTVSAKLEKGRLSDTAPG